MQPMIKTAQTTDFFDEDILHFIKLVSKISARIVRATNDILDDVILQSIKEVLQLLRVDRGGLLEVLAGTSIVRVSHVWYDEGIEQVSSDVNLAGWFPWTYQKIVIEGETLALADCSQLPSAAAKDRESHRIFGNKSTLTIPLFIGNRVHHLLTLDAHKTKREWPDDVVSSLRLLGEVFVSALQRRDADHTLSHVKERLDLAASSANAGLWELDFSTSQFWATDKARELFGYAPDEPVTWDNFIEKVHVDDRPLVTVAVESLANGHSDLNIEYRVPSPDRATRWMHSRGRLSQADDCEEPLMTGVTLDVTRFKKMEHRLQEQLKEIERLKGQLEKENFYLRNELAGCAGRQKVSGSSTGMMEIMTRIEQVAMTGSTVLIQGETGTGKELIAQTVHQQSDRKKRAMIKVNCAALPAALVESELFGREKGAYTGALNQQVGRFEMADGSSIFLDEIAEMPLETQAKLLRVLQEGELERLGSAKTIKVDVRVIAASNRNLTEEVERGRFRKDLYYRLNVFPINVPPLRERTDDIPNLVWEFINEFSERMGKNIRRVTSQDMALLQSYDWPGNVRELRNVIEHSMIISAGDTLNLQRMIKAKSKYPTMLEDVERQHIATVIKAANGRIKGTGGAADLLGLHPSTLYSRMRKLGIHAGLS